MRLEEKLLVSLFCGYRPLVTLPPLQWFCSGCSLSTPPLVGFSFYTMQNYHEGGK